MRNDRQFKLFSTVFLTFFLTLSIFAQSKNEDQKITPPTNATVTVKEDGRIKKLLNIKSKMNFDDRFKIQLYYGNLKEANRILGRYRESFGEWPSQIAYETPNHKVWVGNFRNRLEADRALLNIQRKFPSAFVFKP